MKIINYKYGDMFSCIIHGKIIVSKKEWTKIIAYLKRYGKRQDYYFNVGNVFEKDTIRGIQTKGGMLYNIRVSATSIAVKKFPHTGEYKKGNYMFFVKGAKPATRYIFCKNARERVKQVMEDNGEWLCLHKEPKKRKLPSIKCKQCGKMFTREDLKYCQDGTMFYRLVLADNGQVQDYEQDEFEANESGEYYHQCGAPELQQSEMKKLGLKT